MPHKTARELKQLGIGKKIKALRISKGLEPDELAARLGLSKVLLSQIEDDVLPPTVATLLNISAQLDVGIDHFFTDQKSKAEFEITRPDDRLAVHHEALADSKRLTYDYESLAYRLAEKHMEPFFVEFDASEEASEALTHEGEEFVYVLEGEIEFTLGDEVVRLREGEALYFYAHTPHAIRGIGPGKPKAIIVLYPFGK